MQFAIYNRHWARARSRPIHKIRKICEIGATFSVQKNLYEIPFKKIISLLSRASHFFILHIFSR